MEHLTLCFLLILCPVWANAQVSGLYEKKKLSETEVTTVLAYYTQDGDHSAITGGRGTEELSVLSASTDLQFKFDTTRNILFHLGFDYISSASTDKIDAKVSSASKHDQRIYTNFGYSHTWPDKNLELGASLAFSIESDYFSKGLSAWMEKSSKNMDSHFRLALNIYLDDLRWRKKFYRGTELIYPEELRDTNWFDIHHRNSYNLLAAYRNDINKRMSIILYPGIVYQSGLLSTPFHRVYFEGAFDPMVETLPQHRIKIPLGIQWNSFLFGRVVLRIYYQYYWDDYGIKSNTVNIELPIKQGPFVAFIPFFRYYTQTGATYFKPYKEHSLQDDYFTSDYDLSPLNSLKIGLEFRSTSNKKLFKRGWLFDQFSIRYAYYRRSDGLDAHMLTSLFNISK